MYLNSAMIASSTASQSSDQPGTARIIVSMDPPRWRDINIARQADNDQNAMATLLMERRAPVSEEEQQQQQSLAANAQQISNAGSQIRRARFSFKCNVAQTGN